jgi:hypothetical protein
MVFRVQRRQSALVLIRRKGRPTVLSSWTTKITQKHPAVLQASFGPRGRQLQAAPMARPLVVGPKAQAGDGGVDKG